MLLHTGEHNTTVTSNSVYLSTTLEKPTELEDIIAVARTARVCLVCILAFNHIASKQDVHMEQSRDEPMMATSAMQIPRG